MTKTGRKREEEDEQKEKERPPKRRRSERRGEKGEPLGRGGAPHRASPVSLISGSRPMTGPFVGDGRPRLATSRLFLVKQERLSWQPSKRRIGVARGESWWSDEETRWANARLTSLRARLEVALRH